MDFLKAAGTYAVACKLSNDPLTWVHEPTDMIELNYITATGERRILIEDVSISVNVQGLLIIRARSKFGQAFHGVDLRLYRRPRNPDRPDDLIDFWGVRFFPLIPRFPLM
jgi:hypothetical protein